MEVEIQESTEGPVLIFKCPHCQDSILVYQKDVNCEIFRHGFWKANGTQIPPHSTKNDITKWKEDNLVSGCGKPFRLTKNGTLSVCDYL